jgi:predicted metal-dependent hydrolase
VTADGNLRVTVPRGASIAGGIAFAEREAAWIAREWATLQARTTWGEGTRVWYRGVLLTLGLDDGAVLCGEERVMCGPRQDVRAALQDRWRALAARELPPRCLALARAHGLSPASVRVRDQRSRWGACSGKGAITLNWRLLQMPPDVADYVMLHELAHLRQPNHSRRFWREVDALCPEWRSAERWLRAHGRELL